MAAQVFAEITLTENMRPLQMAQLGSRINTALSTGQLVFLPEGLFTGHRNTPLFSCVTSLQVRGGTQVKHPLLIFCQPIV